MKLAMDLSSLKTICIKIPVKESSFDVNVRNVRSLMSFSFTVELVYFSEKGIRIIFPSLLFTGQCDMYVSNEPGTT